MTLSAHSANTTRELAELIRERLGALSRAHALTLPEITGTGTKVERSTTLSALVRTVLSPYVSETPDSKGGMVISGPEVLVGAQRPQAISPYFCTSSLPMLQSMAR